MSADERDPQTYAIIGAAMEVHNELGDGFLEAVYQEALAVELSRRGIAFQREPALTVRYKGQPLACGYRPDFLCFDAVIVELKAVSGLGPVEQAQLLNYLKVTGLERGLLLNFGGPRLDYRRMVWSSHLRSSASSAVS